MLCQCVVSGLEPNKLYASVLVTQKLVLNVMAQSEQSHGSRKMVKKRVEINGLYFLKNTIFKSIFKSRSSKTNFENISIYFEKTGSIV